MQSLNHLQDHCARIRALILKAGRQGGPSHYGGSLSCVEILTLLYGALLHCSPALCRAQSPERDRFLLSKGHAALALYATLCEFGYLSLHELLSFDADGSALPAHCLRDVARGLELSSGSLGMGLSFGCGTALSLKKRALPGRVYVLCGDGELGEGELWEGARFAAAGGLDNLTLLVDCNTLQLDGPCPVNSAAAALQAQFAAIGWESLCCDGHNLAQLYEALSPSVPSAQSSAKAVPGHPRCVICRTVKGKGVSFMEHEVAWHHQGLDEERYTKALAELGVDLAELDDSLGAAAAGQESCHGA
ncbi:MAG: transketolase [Succinivibrio sp.]|nr:transketolase [Succinivibrio sp.]